MTDSQFGNGKKLAECLKEEFSNKNNVIIADVKEVSSKTVADEAPDILILGGAIRRFRSDPKSKKWLKEFNTLLKNSGKKIQFATGFLTHGLPTEKVQRFAKKYLNKIKTASMITKTYPELLTARVQTQTGPIFPEEMEKARTYAKEFLSWINK